jgi:hypothetical protein
METMRFVENICAPPRLLLILQTNQQDYEHSEPTNLMKRYILFAFILLCAATGQAVAQPGGGKSSVAYSHGATLVITKNATSSSQTFANQTYNQTGSDYNVVKDTSTTATLTDCTLTKTGATASSGDNSSFYGINAALYVSSSAVLTMKGGSITTDADGANAAFCFNGGTLNLYDVTIYNSATRSRGLHCTGGNGATINAYNCTVTTLKATSSTIATDRGGGTVYVKGGTYTANGEKCAIIYSTGNMTVKNITGYSNNTSQGDIADIEGDNSITIDSCHLTCSGTSRGVMLYQSGSGDATGYNPTLKISHSLLTLTSSEAPFCEVSTAVNAYLTLDADTIVCPSNVLAYVHTNSNWNNTNTKYLNLTLKDGTYTGALNADATGKIYVNIASDAVWQGAMDNASTAKADTVVVNGTWIMDANSNVDVLIINKGGKVYTNGYTLNASLTTNNGTLDTTSTNVSAGVSAITCNLTILVDYFESYLQSRLTRLIIIFNAG